jgi:DNA-binding NarL/FixJ family response regulator
LLAEDEIAMQESIQQILEANNFCVLASSNGIDALGLLQTEAVDLILADIAMPGLNGYQLFERVRQNPRWHAIPFVLLSGRAFDSDVRYGKQLGVDDYLIKPFHIQDLLATIQGKLRRGRQLAELVSRSESPQPVQEHETPHTPEPTVSLTQRELDVLRLLVRGKTNREIGQALFISPGTAKIHIEHILDKLGVRDRTAAAVRALDLKLVKTSQQTPSDRSPTD